MSTSNRKPPSRSRTATDGVALLGGRVGALETVLGHLRDSLAAIEARISGLEARQGELTELVLRARHELSATTAQVDGLAAAHKLQAERVDVLTLAVDEGIRHVDRAEKRVRATVGRARRELAEAGFVSPGVEAEAADIHELDGGASGAEGMPPVSAPVDSDPAANAPDPLLETLRALRLSR